MKANEFVKKYGVEEAKKVLHCMDDASEFKVHMPGDKWYKPTLIDAVGLRRLVKSHELVNSVGGLDAANRIICDAFHGSNGDIPEGHEKLSLAIQDVELCHVD